MHVSAWQRYLVQVELGLVHYWFPWITNLYYKSFPKSSENLPFFWYSTCLEKRVSRRFSRCFSSRSLRKTGLYFQRGFSVILRQHLWISLSGAWINKFALSTPLMISVDLCIHPNVYRVRERWLVRAMTYVCTVLVHAITYLSMTYV
jgi:hypothetical protein